MADRVELTFRRAALRLIPEGTALLLAVSGGADSVALLHLVTRLAGRRGLRAGVAHLDHGLRRGSRADRRFVERLAADAGWPAVTDRRDVTAARRRDESLEEAARRVRREFLLDVARSWGADVVATGHTLDDQAETVLMRFVRGAGPAALAGIAERGPGPFVRPLLGLEKTDLTAWLDGRGLAYRDDPSNRDPRFDRNRVRHRVMPLLARELNPRAARHLVEAAERLRADAEYLDAAAGIELQRLMRRTRSPAIAVDAAGLAGLPGPLAARAARLAMLRAGADPRRIGARHVSALLALAGGGGTGIDLPGRLHARRVRDRLLLGPRD